MEREALERELVSLLDDLVAIPSTYPPGDTEAICRFCSHFLSAIGYRVETLERRKGVHNLVARVGVGRPSIVFNAHADTVGVGERANWKSDPFKATVRDGRVYGLGAANCKASMAVQLWLARRFTSPKRGELVFTFVGDEENLGPDGMAFLRESNAVKPDTLIVAAPTRNRLVLEERGVMWVKVVTRGKPAHAGAPHTGESAILRMHDVISRLREQLTGSIGDRRSPSGQQSTLSIGRIRGGENINVVPDFCSIELDRRILPEESFDAAYDELKRTALAAGAAEVELLTGTPGFRAPENGAAVRAFLESIEETTGKKAQRLNVVGASDGRYFARDGIEILVTGPGDGADSHVPDESLPLEELVDAAIIQHAALRKLLG